MIWQEQGRSVCTDDRSFVPAELFQEDHAELIRREGRGFSVAECQGEAPEMWGVSERGLVYRIR